MRLDELYAQRNALQKRLDDINAEIAKIEADFAEKEAEKTAYENALNALFDGLKLVANTDNPFAITFPMAVKANLFYSYDSKTYVCVKNGIVTEATMTEYMTEW